MRIDWIDKKIQLRDTCKRWLNRNQTGVLFAGSGLKSAVVIPCVGEDYAKEGELASHHARKALPDEVEVRLVTNLPREAFGNLQSGVVHDCIKLPASDRSHYRQLWQSRMVKISAPLRSTADLVLMIDSDLMLLQCPVIELESRALCGVFRSGRAFSRIKELKKRCGLPGLSDRNYRMKHMNSGFLAASRETWKILVPYWVGAYQKYWDVVDCKGWPPTDQVALNTAIDSSGILETSLSIWHNWPVSKHWNDDMSQIPKNVIGAHGGFPLSEWERRILDPNSSLAFQTQANTRISRYEDKNA
ncbi:MAG: hypothetical protein SFU85_06400 [Candidatus Methylacidiphilales bacterium]|nr:hypothetical protein [Candidatus Methylacidiphilales bacterium]